MSTVTTATATATATVLAASPQTSVSEAVVFWIVAPVAIAAALAMVFSRHAVHAALLLVVDFFCLAVLYAAQDLSLIHISEPTRLLSISYAVFCLKKKKK